MESLRSTGCFFFHCSFSLGCVIHIVLVFLLMTVRPVEQHDQTFMMHVHADHSQQEMNTRAKSRDLTGDSRAFCDVGMLLLNTCVLLFARARPNNF